MKTITSFKKYLIIGAIAVGSVFSIAAVSNDYFEISKNLDILSTLYREVNTYYVDEVDAAKFMRTGIDAMLESLDPYTNYISESEVEDYKFMTTGQYGGIGSTITQKGDYVVISEPYEGFPAQKAGLRGGDILLEVDGKSVKGKNTSDVSKILKGQPGTDVKVLIRRTGEVKDFEVAIKRQEITVKNVPYYGMVNDQTGYIRLTGFTQEAGKEVREAYVELKKNPKMKSVILDLRENPGGLLHEAVNIANVFVDRGKLVVNTKGKMKEWDKSYNTLDMPVDVSMPMVVLANSRSASASEIVSGVMQDYDRAMIIGQRTFGKGLVQTTRPLTYNTQLKVTTAKYYIPSGRCIQALDYSHRNEDGSVGKVPDSLIKPFKTASGRTVYDGGGIAPDVAIEPRTLSNIAISLLSKRLIFDFATDYRSKHPTIASAREFKIDDALYNEFVKFLADKEYDYTTKSEKALEEYKTAAEKEKYFTSVKDDFEALKAKMAHDKKADLLRFKDEIKELLGEEIITRYYYQRGRIESSFAYDDDVQKAVEVLNNSTLYKETLKIKN